MAEPFSYGGQTILSHPIFVETILPFVLIFTIVFAILQKSKILGPDKKQIDAIVALVVGLLVISFANAVGVIVQMIPFLAVSLVVLLVLYIMLGSFMNENYASANWLKNGLSAVIVLAVVIATLYFTGAWQWLYDLVYGGSLGESNVFMNVLFVVIIVGAMIGVLRTGGAGAKKS